jgi:prevent-host-death family protein
MHRVSAHDAKARFGQLLDTARREPVAIERDGRAVAVVLSKEEYDELNEIKLQRLRAEINQGLADLERGAYADYRLSDRAERDRARAARADGAGQAHLGVAAGKHRSAVTKKLA